MKKCILLVVGVVAFAVCAYLPPVEEKNGLRVEIESFPQQIERPEGSPYAWPLGVTEVEAAKDGATSRPFTVTVENQTDRPVAGKLEVWMNDDWIVAGPIGRQTLAAKSKKSFNFVGTSKPKALSALYPVHARFTPGGSRSVATATPLHPIAVFMFKNPQAPRPVAKRVAPRLDKGVFNLVDGFARTSYVKVGDKVAKVADDGNAREWGGNLTRAHIGPDGGREGYSCHPPYKKGPGVIWSDFPLTLPKITPVKFRCVNYIASNSGQKAPPSDGVEYKVFVREAGKSNDVEAGWKELCGHFVTEPLKWRDMEGDLSAYAGKKIELRLWTGPGPKMNTCCDGGGWGDLQLDLGGVFHRNTESDWKKLESRALVAAMDALSGSKPDKNTEHWLLDSPEGKYGAGVAYGPTGRLVDGVLAFTDGTRAVWFRGFTARVERGNAETVVEPQAKIWVEKGTLRIKWTLPGTKPNERGFPRIADLALGPANERPLRVYAGFGNVIEMPKRFTLHAGGFALSTRHVAADYASTLSVVQAVDVPPDMVVSDGEKNLFSLHAHHDATFTLVPSSKGAFAAARRFRAVSGYKASPGHDKLGSRMCIDQWSGDYAKAAAGLAKAAKYGLNDSIFVKHDWQCWGYDYRLPEIYPPRGDADAFGAMRKACADAGMLFCPHDNYTDIYPDCDNYSYDLVVFNLDGTPQKAWFNPGRHALSYRWAPHAFRPWCLRNAKLLREGYDPDAVFIDVLTAHGPFDYLDREGKFHSKCETSYHWGRAYETYREGYRRPDAVCVSEAGQDHLVGVLDAGQSDHFGAAKLMSRDQFGAAERTPWHDIATHNYFVLFAGGLGGRYQEEGWHKGGDAQLHGYASDDYLSNCIIGGRNPMCDGPFSRNTVKTYWMQHDACAELGKMEFLDLRYEDHSIRRQHSWFGDGKAKGEVWINRSTNTVWRLKNGMTLPSYGYYAKTPTTESGVLEKDGQRYAFAKSPKAFFVDARTPVRENRSALAQVEGVTRMGKRLRINLAWETLRKAEGYQPFVHICETNIIAHEGIVFQCGMYCKTRFLSEEGKHRPYIDLGVPPETAAGTYDIWYGAWHPKQSGRLTIGGSRNDHGSRVFGGSIVVARDAEKIVNVTWKPDSVPDQRAERDRVLGVNRTHRQIDFGGIVTDGSFRLVDRQIIPLPSSEPFQATIDLALLGAKGKKVANVVAMEPEEGAKAPTWEQVGGQLKIKVDAKAFAYRIVVSD